MATVEPSEPKRHALPSPFDTSSDELELIAQGAEALLYKTAFLAPNNLAAVKIRPVKAWRHPTLDKRLTRQRILAEARVLNKCRKEGVSVPAVLSMDWEKGWIASEWIEGKTVKEAIRSRDTTDDGALETLLRQIGFAVGKLHGIGVIHGDLTTSNMMLRYDSNDPGSSMEIVLIDFGLATQAVQEEDRAVDLYVLERAFGSTHPKEECKFQTVLEAYASTFKGAKSTLRRLEDVRMRGRKKSMIG